MPVIIDNLHNSRIEVLSAIEKLIGYTPEFVFPPKVENN
jgi:hypothetical protein